MLTYFLGSNTISSKQSGFRPGDSSVNQPLSVTHDIRVVFLEIFKAFNKVWHDRSKNKLKQNGIKDKLLCILIDLKIATKE